MLTIIRSKDRHFSDFGWLQSHWHFSFGDYHDPKNVNFGSLRVFNDDIVQGGGGFGMHPHRDMEIITYMLDGVLRHEDSLGNSDTLRAGEVQVMSAGTGIRHAEVNHSQNDSLHLLQIWIMPRNKNLPPRWEQKPFQPQQRQNRLLPVVSSGNLPGTLAIDQDAVVYIAALQKDHDLKHPVSTGQRAYLFLINGEIELNGQSLSAGDQARVEAESELSIRAQSDSELVLIDLA